MADIIKCDKCKTPFATVMAKLIHMKKKKCDRFVDKDNFGNRKD
jgi:hypothetical protein